MKKIMLVFGTRPEAIKMCPLVKEIQKSDSLEPVVCVTGQHKEMLEQVLDIFDVKPDYNLAVMKPGQDLYDITSSVLLGMREILKYVYGKGHRKIAYIHGADSSVTQARISSFYTTAAQLGLDVPEEYVREAPYRDTEETYKQTNLLLDLPDPPTCILFPDDYSGLGGIIAIKNRGLRVPEDVSVVGYDGINRGLSIQPSLTTWQQDTETIGREAARRLISQIKSPKTTIIMPVTVPGRLYEGDSVLDLNK